MTKENTQNTINELIIKIVDKCDWMIENSYYMNDIAIRKLADEIKCIANSYYFIDVKYISKEMK